MKITILGAGSWGSALAVAMSSIATICIWSRNKNQVELINRERINSGYLPIGVEFNQNSFATDNLYQAINGTDLLVIATPLNALRSILTQICDCPIRNIPEIVWVCKGFEYNTGLLPHEIIREIISYDKLPSSGALLGPSFAFDVAHGKPTAITLASDNLDFAFKWANIFKDIPHFRVYANADVIGAEVGGAIKNIIAIASGIVDGLGLGLNARAALITRSLSEVAKLAIKLGGQEKTIYGLTGVGDIILTCTGDLSRNRIVGLELAKGHRLDEVLERLSYVAEGVLTTKAVYNLCGRFNIEMPIVEAVYNVLYGGADLRVTIEKLLSREPKSE